MIEGYNQGAKPRFKNQSMSNLSYDQTPQHKYKLGAHTSSHPCTQTNGRLQTRAERAEKIHLVFKSAETRLSTESFYHRRGDATGSSPPTSMETFW